MITNTNRRFLPSIILLFLTFQFIAGGCGKKMSVHEAITMAFWSDNFNRSFAERVVEYYNTHKKPSMPVKFFDMGTGGRDYTPKLLTMVAGGNSPDIMLLMPDEMIEFAARNGILDLTQFALNDAEFTEIRNNSWQDLWQINKFRGKDYGMPIWTNIIALFYNKSLFDKSGILYPDETWTWDTFLSAAKRLSKDTNHDGKIDQFGFGDIRLTLNSWDLYLFIRQNGGDLFNERRTKCLLISSEAIEAIQWVIDLKNKYHVAPTSGEMTSGEFGWGGETPFLTGRVAMIFGGRWMMLPISQAEDFEWSVAPLYRSKRRIANSAMAILTVSARTEYPKECWEFLKFMASEEGQRLVISDRSEISILKSLAYSSEYLNRYSRPKENKVFIKEFEYSEPYPFVLGQKGWMDEGRETLEKAGLDKISVKDACSEIAKKYEQMVISGEIKP